MGAVWVARRLSRRALEVLFLGTAIAAILLQLQLAQLCPARIAAAAVSVGLGVGVV
jgi:hypothetical protein